MTAGISTYLQTLCLVALAPGGAGAALAESPLIWRGCGITDKAFMGACVEAYERETGQQIKLGAGGAALGIRSTAGNSADLGGTCRHSLPELFESERGVETAIIAWDALVAVVHPSNSVDELSRTELIGILRGEITNWETVGGRDQRIIVGGRKSTDSGVGVMARLLILNDPKFKYPRESVLLQSSGPLEEFAERTAGALIITGISSARKRALKTLAIDGVLPQPEQIAAAEYPYFRPLYMVYRPDGDPRALRFVEWIQSTTGQATIASQGTVTLEMGLPLMARYQHWTGVEALSNYDALLARARELEANRASSQATVAD